MSASPPDDCQHSARIHSATATFRHHYIALLCTLGYCDLLHSSIFRHPLAVLSSSPSPTQHNLFSAQAFTHSCFYSSSTNDRELICGTSKNVLTGDQPHITGSIRGDRLFWLFCGAIYRVAFTHLALNTSEKFQSDTFSSWEIDSTIYDTSACVMRDVLYLSLQNFPLYLLMPSLPTALREFPITKP